MRAALGFAACQSKKAQHHIAQGSALGIIVYIMNNAPCKGNTLIIIRLLPLRMGRVRLLTQGVALGYVVLPLRGVTLASFDSPFSYG